MTQKPTEKPLADLITLKEVRNIRHKKTGEWIAQLLKRPMKGRI